MKHWQQFRILLSATIFGAAILVLGKVILYPTSSDRPVSSFVFPSKVALPGWQLLESKPLETLATDNHQYISGKYYRYIHKGLSLDVQMRYLVNTDGDVKNLLKKYTPIRFWAEQVLPVVPQQQGVGFYSLFVYDEKAYLSACINSRGGSTVTDRQFRRNRNLYDVPSSRLLLWLLSQAELRDERCLWAHMSVPVKDSSTDDAYKTLEKAWFSWYKWWSQRFPNP